jgi:hypothetical protein
LDSFHKTIPPYPHQKGVLVFINRKVAGFDIVSSESACVTIHPKPLRSYAMDTLLDKENEAALNVRRRKVPPRD